MNEEERILLGNLRFRQALEEARSNDFEPVKNLKRKISRKNFASRTLNSRDFDASNFSLTHSGLAPIPIKEEPLGQQDPIAPLL